MHAKKTEQTVLKTPRHPLSAGVLTAKPSSRGGAIDRWRKSNPHLSPSHPVIGALQEPKVEIGDVIHTVVVVASLIESVLVS